MAAETAEMKLARESAEKRGGIFQAIDGKAVITCGASELVPTVQYGNCTIGPISVQRVVADDANLAAEIQKTQQLCEAAVAEERQTIHALTRGRAKS